MYSKWLATGLCRPGDACNQMSRFHLAKQQTGLLGTVQYRDGASSSRRFLRLYRYGVTLLF